MLDGKEPIPELDEAIGVEEVIIQPGTEVWHKAYNRAMVVIYIIREYCSKELEYGLLYIENEKEAYATARSYAMIPLEQRINIYANNDGKVGSLFSDPRFSAGIDRTDEGFFNPVISNDYNWAV